MKKFIKIIIIVFMLICIALIEPVAESDADNSGEVKIAFIGATDNGDYWNSMKMGADIAEKDFNVHIDYMIPSGEDDTNDQIKFISKAIYNKVDAIIINPMDYKSPIDIINKAMEHGIYVIVVDSELNSDKISSFIGSENFEAGKMAGQEIINLCGTNCNIAVIGFFQGNPIGEKREQGIINVIKHHKNMKVIEKEYCSKDQALAFTLTRNMLNNISNIDVIVALNSAASEGAAQAVYDLKLKDKVKIISFDSTPREIEYMESGIINATIIQNPFSMGYFSVKNAAYAAKGKTIKKTIYTGTKLIDNNNMYSSENQKLLFPFVK